VTGDYQILDEEIQFLESPPLGEHDERYIIPTQSAEYGSLYEHCIRALNRAYKLGERGLPLMGAGDWNDGMNEVGTKGRGESVWLGWFLAHTNSIFAQRMRESTRDLDHTGERLDLNSRLEERSRNLVAAIESSSWDGNWYRRAYCDDGVVLGSSESDECKIDSISQSWSVITGTGDTARARMALDSVKRYLVDEESRIIKLLTPPFFEGRAEPGFIKGYLRGIRENGGQYTHAATWVVIAEAMLGRGDTAFELFQMLNPITHCADEVGIQRYKGEPYALCGDVYGVAPHQGRAGWSWYTGSAGWLFQAAVHHILGITIKRGATKGDTLEIDPCIPSSWREWSVELTLPKKLTITFKNPSGTEKGIKELFVGESRIDLISGKKVSILLTELSGDAEITVIMGDN
jgi:cellobiose phosphorylase